MKTKREEKEKFWKRHVERYSSSGLTKKAYCLKNELSYWSFNDWKKRLNKTNQSRKLTEIPLTMVDIIPNTFDKFEIIFKENLRISIPNHFKPEVLIKIIEMLRNIT